MYSMAKSCLHLYDAKHQVPISHVLAYSFIVFKPTERKIHYMENWLIFWGIWGEA